MKMKRSITFQVFFTILIVLLSFLAIQMFVFSNLFTPFYSESMLSDIRSEFRNVTQNFGNGGENSVSAVLRDYTVKYQAPVLVFTNDFRIMDRYFFDQMSLLTLLDKNNAIYKVHVEDINKLTNANMFEKLHVEAVKLGNSAYYEPYLIRSEKQTYMVKYDSVYNPGAIKNQKIVDSVQNWYSQQAGGKIKERAQLIYSLVKDCLMNRTDIQACVNKITRTALTDNTGSFYYIISQQQTINGLTYYFLTIRPIVLTGNEARYFNQYFYYIFIILCIFMIIAAYVLSQRFSMPVLKLSAVTKRLANQDFSERADISSKNEIGQLSSDINLLADNLEKSIAELQQAAKNAQLNEMEMKRLLADLAHEFKTPLGIISLYVEAIEKWTIDKGPEQFFKTIEHEINNLTQMIDETIQFTKMQAGFLEYKPDLVELNDLIDNVLTRFSEVFMKERFTLEVHALDVTVIADGRRIEQVLYNLISNAVKYSTDIRHIKLNVTREGRTVTIVLSNYSYVSDDDLKKIWERYYRAADETTTRLPSQGLGLEIVRGILNMHNSEYSVRQEGAEICFCFTLQAAEEKNEDETE